MGDQLVRWSDGVDARSPPHLSNALFSQMNVSFAWTWMCMLKYYQLFVLILKRASLQIVECLKCFIFFNPWTKASRSTCLTLSWTLLVLLSTERVSGIWGQAGAVLVSDGFRCSASFSLKQFTVKDRRVLLQLCQVHLGDLELQKRCQIVESLTTDTWWSRTTPQRFKNTNSPGRP